MALDYDYDYGGGFVALCVMIATMWWLQRGRRWWLWPDVMAVRVTAATLKLVAKKFD